MMNNYTVNRVERKVSKMPAHYILVGLLIIILALIIFFCTGYTVRYADDLEIETIVKSADQNMVEIPVVSKSFLNELSKNQLTMIHIYTSPGHYQTVNGFISAINYDTGLVGIRFTNSQILKRQSIDKGYPLIVHIMLIGKEKSILSRILTGKSVSF